MSDHAFTISGVGLSHREAPLSALESASYVDPIARTEELLDRDSVAEAVVLQTCNRVEEYVVTRDETAGRAALEDFAVSVDDDVIVERDHQESLRHLLRVAAGLESQVLGEDQVLGQVRAAYAAAKDVDAIGPVLEQGLLKAVHVGERARSETDINEGTVSLGSAAVELVSREVGLSGRTVTIVGAGESARAVAHAIAEHDVADLRLVNRTLENAERVAADVAAPTACFPLESLPAQLGDADVVVSTTGSEEPIIDPGVVADAEDLLAIDLAQPRDIDPGVVAVPGVTVRDLEALNAITDETHENRSEAAAAVEAIVDEEFDRLIDQYKRRRADAVIAAMYRGAERIKQRELAEARSKLERGDADESEVLAGLADAIVSQLMAVPTESLRDAAANDDWETISTALQLFDPNLDAERRRELLSTVPSLADDERPVEAPAEAGDDE